MSDTISLPEISEHEKIRNVIWARVFLINEKGELDKELEVEWLAESGMGIGLRNAPEGTYNIWIECYIHNCDQKYWGYQTQITFMKREKDVRIMIFHVTGKRIPLDFGSLLKFKTGNQSDPIGIEEILGRYGIKESSHTPKNKKKDPWKFTQGLAYVSGMCILGVSVFIHYAVVDHVDTGAIATPIIVQEIPANKGVIEDIVKQGDFVKKGDLLARVIDPNITSSLTLLDDKQEDARKQEIVLRNKIEAGKIDLENKKAMATESHAFLVKRMDLEKQGFLSSSVILVDKQKVVAEESAIANVDQQIKQLKVELETLLKTWGNNFSKNDKQKSELQKQMKGSEFISKCDCYVFSVDSDVRAITIKLRPKDRFYIEAALPKDTVATMKDGQSVWFTTPGSDIYKKGTYKITELQKNTRYGVSNETFAGTKTSIIAVVPNEPITGGEEIIGKPVSLMLHTSSVSTTTERIMTYFK